MLASLLKKQASDFLRLSDEGNNNSVRCCCECRYDEDGELTIRVGKRSDFLGVIFSGIQGQKPGGVP